MEPIFFVSKYTTVISLSYLRLGNDKPASVGLRIVRKSDGSYSEFWAYESNRYYNAYKGIFRGTVGNV